MLPRVIGYEIYLDPNELSVANGDSSAKGPDDADMTDTTYDPAADLAYETTYYWRVDALEPNDVRTIAHPGPVWSFTTAPEAPEVKVDPKDMTADAAGKAVFTVEGINQTRQEWYKYVDGVNDELKGTDAVLTLENVVKDDEGLYYCVLIGKVGTEPAKSGTAQLWSRREMAHWDFEDTLTDSLDGWVGVYSDPNENNPAPDPASDYYYIDDTNAISGKAFDFRNNENFITVSDSGDFFNFHPFGYTANCWMKIDEAGDWELAFAKIMEDRSAGWGLGRYQGTGFMGVRGTGLYPDVFGGEITIGENEWHMVTIQYDPEAKRYKIYVDGEFANQSGEVAQVIAVGDAPLTIGAETDTGRAPINGVIDEVRIWSYALDPVDIAVLYTDLSRNIACVDDEGLQYDYNDNCIVDLADFAVFAQTWMNCRRVPTCLP